MRFEKGQILCIWEGDYSDTEVRGVVVVTTAFDPDEVENTYRPRPCPDSPNDFLLWLIAQGYVKQIGKGWLSPDKAILEAVIEEEPDEVTDEETMRCSGVSVA